MGRSHYLAVAAVLLLSGCGQRPPPEIVPVEGLVLLEGKPVRNATVRFIPASEQRVEYVASGVTDEAGHFTLTCKGQPGACVGENHVLVVEGPIPKKLLGENAQVELAAYFETLGGRPLPPEYGNLVSSPLSAQVVPEQRPLFRFDLKR